MTLALMMNLVNIVEMKVAKKVTIENNTQNNYVVPHPDGGSVATLKAGKTTCFEVESALFFRLCGSLVDLWCKTDVEGAPYFNVSVN